MSVADRLAGIRERIRRSGRDPTEVEIVAVTKGRSVADCAEALACGLTMLGENRVQEALPKMERLPDAAWHLIGHLQSNKVGLASRGFALIHSVDSVQLAGRIAARSPRQQVLLQVNVSGEPEKHGVRPESAVEMAGMVALLLPLAGLMGMAPREGDPRPAFELLAHLQREARERTGHPLPTLSMGMSDDFEAALSAGSTMLRLGRALFGS